jgi:hypothetical protein
LAKIQISQWPGSEKQSSDTTMVNQAGSLCKYPI